MEPLGDHAKTTSGSIPSRGNKQYWQPAEIAWVKTGGVAFAPITATEEAISKTVLAECPLLLLPPKTILIARYGQGKARGQLAILEIPATTKSGLFRHSAQQHLGARLSLSQARCTSVMPVPNFSA